MKLISEKAGKFERTETAADYHGFLESLSKLMYSKLLDRSALCGKIESPPFAAADGTDLTPLSQLASPFGLHY